MATNRSPQEALTADLRAATALLPDTIDPKDWGEYIIPLKGWAEQVTAPNILCQDLYWCQ